MQANWLLLLLVSVGFWCIVWVTKARWAVTMREFKILHFLPSCTWLATLMKQIGRHTGPPEGLVLEGLLGHHEGTIKAPWRHHKGTLKAPWRKPHQPLHPVADAKLMKTCDGPVLGGGFGGSTRNGLYCMLRKSAVWANVLGKRHNCKSKWTLKLVATPPATKGGCAQKAKNANEPFEGAATKSGKSYSNAI